MFKFIRGIFNIVFGAIFLVISIACGGMLATAGEAGTMAVFLIFTVCFFLAGVGCLASAYEHFSGKKLK